MPNFRVAGKFMKAIPYLGDAFGVGLELINPDEPNMGQRMKNAGIVGLGEVGASVLTGGLDFVPDVFEIATELGVETDDPVIDRLQKISPLLNPEHYLRKLSYGGPHEATDALLEKAREDALTPAEDQSIMGRINRMRTPAFGGLMMPMR